MPKTIIALAAALMLVGAGCQDAPPPAPNPPPEATAFDVTKTTCPEIDAARQKVEAAFDASVKAAADTYAEAHAAFQSDLQQCLSGIWNGGPCDKEWAASEQAYQNASNDISNDQFYHEWKKAKSDWDACHAKWEEKYKDWSDANTAKEQRCQEEFQAKVDAANAAYHGAVDAAKKKRDADRAYLDDLEKKCKEPKPTGTGTTGGVTTGGTETGGTTAGGSTGGTTTTGVGGTTKYHPESAACQDAIPGENAPVRQGKASDFGPSDILVGLMTTVAEDVTGSPIPSGAIDDKIFAGMVVAKINSRIKEMDLEAIDHVNDTRWNRRYEQQRARYVRALSVWGAIAQGKSLVPQVKKDAAAIGAMPAGGCRTDADCGQSICCSAKEIATFTCDTSTGACRPQKKPCDDPTVCAGKPAACVAPPVKVRAIQYNGKYLPLDQLKIENETGCGADHYHAKSYMVKATDGSTVYDPGPQCGFGKVSEKPTVEVEVPAGR